MVKLLIRSVWLALLFSHAFAQRDHADFDLPPTDPSDPTSKHTEYWEQKKYCHREYFDMTRQNMVASHVDQWYPKQIETLARRYPNQFIARGEVALFGQVGWNDFSYQCSIYLDGCTQVPTCEQVVHFVRANSPEKSTANILNLSRKIWFAAKQIDSIARDYKFSYNMVELVENHVLMETKNLIQTFSIQPDSQADGICSLIVASINSAINLGTVALGTWGTIPGSIVSIVSTGASVVQGAAAMAVGEGGGPRGGTVAKEVMSKKPKDDLDEQTADPHRQHTHIGHTMQGLDGIHEHDPIGKLICDNWWICSEWIKEKPKKVEFHSYGDDPGEPIQMIDNDHPPAKVPRPVPAVSKKEPEPPIEPVKPWNPDDYTPHDCDGEHCIAVSDFWRSSWAEVVIETKPWDCKGKGCDLVLPEEVPDTVLPDLDAELAAANNDYIVALEAVGLRQADGALYNADKDIWEPEYDEVSNEDWEAGLRLAKDLSERLYKLGHPDADAGADADSDADADAKADALLSARAMHTFKRDLKLASGVSLEFSDENFVEGEGLDDIKVNILDTSSRFTDRWDALERAFLQATSLPVRATLISSLSRRQQVPRPVQRSPAPKQINAASFVGASIRTTVSMMQTGLKFHQSKRPTMGGEVGGIGLGNAQTAQGWCAAFGGGIPNQNSARASTMENYIKDQKTNLRVAISQIFDMTMNGGIETISVNTSIEEAANGTTPSLETQANVTVAKHLSNMMRGKTASWPKYGGVPSQPAHDVELTAIQNFREFMMTGILRNSHCYVKCTSYQNADNHLCKYGKDFTCSKDLVDTLKEQYEICKKEMCPKSQFKGKKRDTCKNEKCDRKNAMNMIKDAENEYKSCQKDKSIPDKTPKNILSRNRACRDDGYACQTACWTSRNDLNREVSLLGKDRLGKYNLTVADVRDKSIANYEERGNSANGTPLGRFLKSTMLAGDQPSYMALPVCKSDQVEMGDFDNEHTHGGGFHGINKRLPCTCGDWRSNETADFMKAVGYAPHQAVWADPNARDTLGSLCPRNLHKLPPLNRYLAYCELHILHPHKSSASGGTYKFDHGDLIQGNRIHLNMTDIGCESIKSDVAAMQEDEANYWFCLRSLEAKRLFSEERGLSWIPGGPVGKKQLPSHKKLCNEYVKKMQWTDVNVMDYPAALALKSMPWEKEELDEKDFKNEANAEISEVEGDEDLD